MDLEDWEKEVWGSSVDDESDLVTGWEIDEDSRDGSDWWLKSVRERKKKTDPVRGQKPRLV